MDLWEWLGIPPTTDIARIKAAYARQAKLYHPEEHPAEFKALQNAYKTALRLAKRQKAYEEADAAPGQAEAAAAKEAETDAAEDVSESETAETAAEEAEADAAEKVSGTEAVETPADNGDMAENAAAHDYDFSEIDSYGGLEQFLIEENRAAYRKQQAESGRFRKRRRLQQMMWAGPGAIAVICIIVVLAVVQIMGERQASAQQLEYIKELYGLEEGMYSAEELEEYQKNYNNYWRYAEDGIDDVLERYQEWEDYDELQKRGGEN